MNLFLFWYDIGCVFLNLAAGRVAACAHSLGLNVEWACWPVLGGVSYTYSFKKKEAVRA